MTRERVPTLEFLGDLGGLSPRLEAGARRAFGPRQPALPGVAAPAPERPMSPELREQIARAWEAWAGNDEVRREFAAGLRAEADARARDAAQRGTR